TFILALAVTMALIPPLMELATRLSLVDVPDERKVHSTVVPRVGGIAMVIGVIVPLVLWLPLQAELVGLLAALTVILLFGAWDDSKDLDYRIKFAGQFLAAGIAVFIGGIKISVLPFLGLEPVSDYIAAPLTIVFLVGVTNAINLSDGLDGLAAGIALLSACAIGLLAYMGNGMNTVLICFAISGVIFGFLRFNTFPARLFMGDTGSQFLGFMLGALSILLTQKTNTALNPLLPLFLLGVPIVDTAIVMLRRLREGRSPFSPDKGHIHHRLLALGMAHYEAVAVIYLAQMIFIGAALLLRYEADLVVFGVYVGLFAAIVMAFAFASASGWQVRRDQIAERAPLSAKRRWLEWLPIEVLKFGIPLYLLGGTMAAGKIPTDLKLSALMLLVILSARLIWADRLRFLPLRVLIFSATAFAVYLINYDAHALSMIPFGVRVGMFVLLLLLLVLAVRFAQKGVFQTTPTDLLVIALAGGIGVMYEYNILDDQLAPMMVELIGLFYAGEIVMRQMRKVWNSFTIGMLLVLLAIAGRLVI
ncbi:MAG: MraY family glycosyltransferase, partial [Thiogranum sp.]|nr:MraY family glycosyltransferase [Thiogranum sp.]